LDYTDPNGPTIELALARIPARGPGPRAGSILVDPGGPGISGVDEILTLPNQLSPAVEARYDVVGWDRRGVGRSSPLWCRSPDEMGDYARALAGAQWSSSIDSPEVKSWAEQAQAFADGCEAGNADLLAHIGTRDSARDMESIRVALGEPGGAERRGGRGFLALALVVLIGLAAATAWLARRPEFAGPPVPDPNGYDTLLAAGRLVTGTAPEKMDGATDEELRAFVAANAKALAVAQPGFEQESVVPLGRMESIEAPLEESGPFRQLARALSCQAVLARREGRTSEALQANVSLLRLSRAASRGGLLLAQSIGAAILRPAIQELDGPLLPKLSASEASPSSIDSNGTASR